MSSNSVSENSIPTLSMLSKYEKNCFLGISPAKSKPTKAEKTFVRLVQAENNKNWKGVTKIGDQVLKETTGMEKYLENIVHLKVGTALYQMGQYEEAIKTLGTNIQSRPKDSHIAAMTLLQIGKAHFAIGNYETAHAYAKLGLERNYFDTDTTYQLVVLETATDPTPLTPAPRPPALYTACLGTADIHEARRLLAEGADPNEKDPVTGETPLMIACQSDENLPVAQLLIISGARIDETNNIGETAASLAQESGARKMTQFLQAPHNFAMFNAAKNNDVATMKQLILHTSYIDWRHPATGETALMSAIRADAGRAIKFLLDQKASVNTMTNKYGQNALEIAKSQESPNPRIIKALEKRAASEFHPIYTASATRAALNFEPFAGPVGDLSDRIRPKRENKGQPSLRSNPTLRRPFTPLFPDSILQDEPNSSSDEEQQPPSFRKPLGQRRLVRCDSSLTLPTIPSSSQLARPTSPGPDQWDSLDLIDIDEEELNLGD